MRFQKPTSKMNSNQFINSGGSYGETEEYRTVSAVDCALSNALKESKRLMSHATLGVTKPVDTSQPDEKTKAPVVLMIPDSKSGIRIFRTRSDGAIGQSSSVSSKFLRSRMAEIEEEDDGDVNHVSKKGRYEAGLETNCPDKGGENKPGQQVAYLKLAVPGLVLRQNSFMQASAALVNNEYAENSVEPTSQGLGSGNDFRESFNSASETLLGRRTSAALGLAVSTENNYLSDSTNVLLRNRQFLPAFGKENAVHANSEYNVKSGDHGTEMQKKLSGLFKTSNITLRRISSFDLAPSAPKFYFGMPLSSSNIANMKQPLGLHSSSNTETPNQPISSVPNLATMQHPLVSSVTAMHNDVKPAGADGLAKMSPLAPRVIFLRKLPSAGAIQSSNQFHGFPSFMNSSPQRFSPHVDSENFLGSKMSSSSEDHSFQAAMDS